MFLTRRITAIVLTLILATMSLGGVTAQESMSAFASGLNTPATAYDDRGNPVGTISVLEIELNWTPDTSYSQEPDPGQMYVVLTLEVSNPTSRPIQVATYTVGLYDNSGQRLQTTWVSSDELVDDNITVPAGESVQFKNLWVMWEDGSPAMVHWQYDWMSNAFIILVGDE